MSHPAKLRPGKEYPSSSTDNSLYKIGTPAKRPRGEDNDEDLAEEGQGSLSTNNTISLYNIYPKYYDIHLTLSGALSSKYTSEVTLDFRKILTCKTWDLSFFKECGNFTQKQQNIFEQFLDKLDSPNWAIQFTNASSYLKPQTMYKIHTQSIGGVTTKNAESCSQPICVAYKNKDEERFLANSTAEENFDYKYHNWLQNNSTIKSYKLGDLIPLHEEYYGTHWIQIPQYKSDNRIGNVGDLFEKHNWLGGTYTDSNFTLPINSKWNAHGQDNLCKIDEKDKEILKGMMSDHQKLPTDPQISRSTTYLKEDTNDHKFNYIFVHPVSDGMRGIAEGYLRYDLVRQCSFVLRLYDGYGTCANELLHRRFPNFEIHRPKTDSTFYTTFKAIFKNEQAFRGYVPSIH